MGSVRRTGERPYGVLTTPAGLCWSLWAGRCNDCGQPLGLARTLALVIIGTPWLVFESIGYDAETDGPSFAGHRCPAQARPQAETPRPHEGPGAYPPNRVEWKKRNGRKGRS